MTNDKKYDLEERTAKFGESIIKLARKVDKNVVTTPIISQLVRSGTSVGANYCEADNAESKTDFRHKISICKKEAKETRHWIRMLATADPRLRSSLIDIWNEATELTLIFNAIANSTKKNI